MLLPARAVRSVLFSFLLVGGFPAMAPYQRSSALLLAQKDSRNDARKSSHVYTNDDPEFSHPPADEEKDPDTAAQSGSEGEKLTIYAASPMEVVEKMLEATKIASSDVVYDLGSGDGRIVIRAAQKYGARAVGIELDPKLVEESRQKVREANLAKLVTIIQGDMLKTNLKAATVVTIYLTPQSNEKLRPVLERELQPGTRVVSEEAPMPGWTWLRSETVNIGNTSHYIFIYQIPDAFRNSR